MILEPPPSRLEKIHDDKINKSWIQSYFYVILCLTTYNYNSIFEKNVAHICIRYNAVLRQSSVARDSRSPSHTLRSARLRDSSQFRTTPSVQEDGGKPMMICSKTNWRKVRFLLSFSLQRNNFTFPFLVIFLFSHVHSFSIYALIFPIFSKEWK